MTILRITQITLRDWNPLYRDVYRNEDAMIMQDRAKRTMFYHDLGMDVKINHVLDKHSMVANSFFW